MKIVILALPGEVKDEAINNAIVALMNATQITDVNVNILNTDEFTIPSKLKIQNEEIEVKKAIEEIAKTCTSNGNTAENIFANYMHLMSSGKLSPERIALINKYPEIINKVTTKYNCTYLRSLLKGSHQYYG